MFKTTSEFSSLRLRAKQKLDRGVAALKAEYQDALAKIAVLEQDLLGMRHSTYKSISSAIEQVIPREATFTVTDLLAALEALDPRRVWRRRSIDNHLSRLRARGLVRRIQRSHVTEPAVYVRADSPVKGPQLGDMTLLQLVGSLLTRPMTTTQVTVAVLEAGWQTTMKKHNLRNHVHRVLRQGDWKLQGGKWLP